MLLLQLLLLLTALATAVTMCAVVLLATTDCTSVSLQCAASVLTDTAPVVAARHFLHVHSHHVPDRRSSGESLAVTADFVTVFAYSHCAYRAVQYRRIVL
jgi:hypothetical protein